MEARKNGPMAELPFQVKESNNKKKKKKSLSLWFWCHLKFSFLYRKSWWEIPNFAAPFRSTYIQICMTLAVAEALNPNEPKPFTFQTDILRKIIPGCAIPTRWKKQISRFENTFNFGISFTGRKGGSKIYWLSVYIFPRKKGYRSKIYLFSVYSQTSLSRMHWSPRNFVRISKQRINTCISFTGRKGRSKIYLFSVYLSPEVSRSVCTTHNYSQRIFDLILWWNKVSIKLWLYSVHLKLCLFSRHVSVILKV